MIDLTQHEDRLIAHFSSITEEEWDRRFKRHRILQHPPITYGIPSTLRHEGRDFLIEREWWGSTYDKRGNMTGRGLRTGRLRVSLVPKTTAVGWCAEQAASAVIVYGSLMDAVAACVSKLDSKSKPCYPH